MALVETATAVIVSIVIVTIAAFWVLSRLVFWSLQAEDPTVRGYWFEEIKSLYQLALIVLVVIVVWPGLSSWAAGAFRWALEALP